MLVKFFRNKGAGSAKASVDYLLGRKRDRENARVIAGNPELTSQLADSLKFANRYTVGCLSFEESELSEQRKLEIIASFEDTLLAGLDKSQYSSAWVEHTDKGRLELNFLIANVELTTGKRLQPYYDRADKGLLNAWRDLTNHDFKLSNPNDPNKRQSLATTKDLPKDKQAFKKALTEYLEQCVLADEIKNRDDVLKTMESLGLEIARTTPNAISIKDPNGGLNIRLKGGI